MKQTQTKTTLSLKHTLLAAAIAQGLIAGAASAATITVNSLLDDGEIGFCTLREAIDNANGGAVSDDCTTGDSGADTIVFDPGLSLPATIILGGTELAITDALTITGPGADQLAISGNNTSRIFNIDDSDGMTFLPVNISGLTLTQGSNTATGFGSGAGGALVNRESLVLTQSVLSNNSAGSRGGALSNYQGTMTLSNSTLSGNTASYGAGGLFSYNADTTVTGITAFNNTGQTGGAILGLYGSLSLTNSTLSGNNGTNRGGAMDIFNATINVINSTLVNNTADLGSGVYANQGNLTLTNTVIANNTGSGALSFDCLVSGATITSTGNLIEDNTCSPALSGTLQPSDLDLTLGSNGGPTQTHAVLTGSRLVDAGVQASCDADGIVIDQTGMMRPVDADGDGDAFCDIGAFEYVDVVPPQPSLNNSLGNVDIGGGNSLPINVNFLDENPLDLTTLGIANLNVSPGATIVNQSLGMSTNGDRDVDVTYTVVPPGGDWDSNDNGTFTVSIVPGQVFDTAMPSANSAASAQVLGTFEVAVAEIDVTGNAISIADGDTTPSVDDDTDFGNVPVGVDSVRTFTITNTALGVLNLISSVSVTGTSRITVQDQPAQTLLNAGESTTFNVTFNSSIAGQVTGTVFFETNDSDEDPYTFVVTGNATEPEIDITGNGLGIADGDNFPQSDDGTDFGLIATGSNLVRSFVVTNSGNDTLTVSDVAVSGAGFSVGTLTPGGTIAVGESSSFDLTFAPAVEGTVTGTVTITSDDANENPYTFDVTGDSTAPDIQIIGNASSIANGDTTPDVTDTTDFGNVILGTDATQVFSISNAGIGTINLTLPVTVTGTAFSITSQPDDLDLGLGESTSFAVTANPGSTGANTGIITIVSDDPDENPFTFTVGSNGITPEIDVSGNGQPITAGDTTPNEVDGTGFGEVLVGASQGQIFTVSNTGTSALNLDTLAVTGAGFDVTMPAEMVVPVGSSTNVEVTFEPVLAGAVAGAVTIVSDDLDENPYIFDLAATGITPEIEITGNNALIIDGDTTPSGADGTDFGDVAVGDSITRSFVINNAGTAALEIGSIESSFLRFEVSAAVPATLQVGQSLNVEVTFRPVIEMVIAARITIENNDVDESPFTFDVSANGVETSAPVIASNEGFSVLPGAAVGTVVGQVLASDADADIPASGAWAITGGNSAGAFAISDDGTITVADTAALAPTTLTVRVTDAGGLSDTATINIALAGESIFANGFE